LVAKCKVVKYEFFKLVELGGCSFNLNPLSLIFASCVNSNTIENLQVVNATGKLPFKTHDVVNEIYQIEVDMEELKKQGLVWKPHNCNLST
jgi:hypothetical protein